MLDENLPTFLFRPMPDTPNSAVIYFTRSGSDPRPEYVLRLADPVSKPACRGVYAAALTDPFLCSDVIYGEVAVRPQWQQPTLSAAELRDGRDRQQAAGQPPGASADAPVPKVPDTFSVQLYNPDQSIVFRWTPRSWNKAEAWEFHVPTQSFRLPSASRLDREPAAAAATAAAASVLSDAPALEQSPSLQPKTTFRWKRDGRLGNKDMTCYLTTSSSSGSSSHHRRREPDITIALYKHGRDPAVTIYEPNLQRVDVQDRKGLELVLLLGVEVIRDLYLVPRADPFHVEGVAAAQIQGAPQSARRQNSRPSVATAGPTMHGALPDGSPTDITFVGNMASSAAASSSVPSAAAIDAETKRLQAMLEREEREREQREREEEQRIKRMLEAEEKEQRERDAAAIAQETDRLRQLYGMQGQDLPSQQQQQTRPSEPQRNHGQRPSVSFAPSTHGSSHPPPRPPNPYANPQPPPRPMSVGPTGRINSGNGSGSGSGGGVSGFFSSLSSSAHRNRLTPQPGDQQGRMQKKRSVYF